MKILIIYNIQMILGNQNLTLKKKVGLELNDKLNLVSEIYHRFGVSNPELINNASWLHLTKYPQLGHLELRTKSHLYHNDNGKFGAIWTFCRKGMSKSITSIGEIYIGGWQGINESDPDLQYYNDIILHDLDGNTHIYGYPKDIFPPIHDHETIQFKDKLVIVGGSNNNNLDDKLKIYQLDFETFRIDLLTTHKKAQTLLKPELKITNGKLKIRKGVFINNKINRKKYTFNLIKGQWE